MHIIFLLSSYSNSSPSTFFKSLSIVLPEHCKHSFFYVKPRSYSFSALFCHFKDLLRLIYLANSRRCIVFSLGLSSDLFRHFCLLNSLSASFCRGELTKDYQYSFGFLGYLIGLLHLKLISFSSCPVTMHSDMQCYFYGLTKRSSFLMYNYNDPSTLFPLRRFSSPTLNDTINFSIVGSLSRLKNIEEAIFIFSGFIRNTSRKLHLNIFGSGPRESELRHLVGSLRLSEFVSFWGFQSASFIHSNTNILLHSSLTEGTSRAVLESLQSSSLVVHRNISGVYSVIEHGRNGFIYESPSHAVSLLPSILSLYDSLYFQVPTHEQHANSLIPVAFSDALFKSSVASLISFFPALKF